MWQQSMIKLGTTTPHHNCLPGWACARRELLDFMVQWEINKGRHTDHPAGHHCIGLTSAPDRPSCRPANSVKALKATSAFGLGRRH